MCRGVYTDEYKKTIGVDFLEKTVCVASACGPRWVNRCAQSLDSLAPGRAACSYVNALGEDVRMMVWDTAGQEEFDAMTRTYYRGEVCVVRHSRLGRHRSTGAGGAGDGWRGRISHVPVCTAVVGWAPGWGNVSLHVSRQLREAGVLR